MANASLESSGRTGWSFDIPGGADAAEVVRLLGSRVPTWLPKGFGLFIGLEDVRRLAFRSIRRCDLDG